MLLRRTGEMTTPTLPRVTFKLAGGLGGKGSGEQLGHTERTLRLLAVMRLEGFGGAGMALVGQEISHWKFDAKAFMPKRVNAEISRRYDIDKNEIGSGGYGKVFIGRDRNMRDRLVAIKKVIIFEDAKKKAFLQEAQIMKDLDHPNICKLLETYEQGRALEIWSLVWLVCCQHYFCLRFFQSIASWDDDPNDHYDI
ncbi:unnamed protein product [Cladocopium goreaui]|uniref:Calcium-dependent protein kinase 2 (PfCDPK2) n=1 Tax=Cladocopium goreaui TaxID=2562237 RepID=A0A9P1CH30_9DINO|nr:unnamed protein product [Cladocopium goreaui]